MTDFQKSLKESGFIPGGSGDFSERNYMKIDIPRLAYINIIGSIRLARVINKRRTKWCYKGS
jgi:hypothetical protein